jgi:hypothetical protein
MPSIAGGTWTILVDYSQKAVCKYHLVEVAPRSGGDSASRGSGIVWYFHILFEFINHELVNEKYELCIIHIRVATLLIIMWWMVGWWHYLKFGIGNELVISI